MQKDQIGRAGVGFLVVKAERFDKIKAKAQFVFKLRKGERLADQKISAWTRFKNFISNAKIKTLDQLPSEFFNFRASDDCFVLIDTNTYVNTGLTNSLQREFTNAGTVVGFIGVSSDSAPVTPTTTFLNGASAGTNANTIIKPVSPANVVTAQTATAGATFTNADFPSGVFVWNKLGLLTTAADAGTGLVDVIGGVGGVAPYNKAFTLNLTSAGQFSATLQIAVTAQAA